MSGCFLTSLGPDEQHYTYVYEDRTTSASNVTGVAGTGTGTGLTNTWYIKVGADAEVKPDLNVGANLYYLESAQKLSIAYPSKKIGTEIDANLTYKLDRHLVYFVEAGYLFTGNMYKNFTSGSGPDDPYVLRHGLRLNF